MRLRWPYFRFLSIYPTKYYKVMKKSRNIYCKFGNIFKKLAKSKIVCYNVEGLI